MSNKVFVGNLNFQTTQDELVTLFTTAGQVVDSYLPVDRATGRPRGFAFVEFATPAEAEKAIEELNGKELGGRELNVNLAEDRPRRPSPAPFQGGSPGGFGGGRGGGAKPSRPKGSRRGKRAQKRSL